MILFVFVFRMAGTLVTPPPYPVQVVQTRRCPLQCMVACIISLVMECSHNLGGLQPYDDYESSGEIQKRACTPDLPNGVPPLALTKF